jgi:hypothetical protein
MFMGAAGICQGIRFCLDRVHARGISGQLAAGVTLGRFLLAAMGKKTKLFFLQCGAPLPWTESPRKNVSFP